MRRTRLDGIHPTRGLILVCEKIHPFGETHSLQLMLPPPSSAANKK